MITLVRHKYIPPLMENFTDLVVISKRNITHEVITEEHIKQLSDYSRLDEVLNKFIKEKHEIVVDSMYFDHKMVPLWKERYESVLQLKANGLLMDEHTMRYY